MFRGVYLGLVFNILIMASVTLAAMKIGAVLFAWSPVQTVIVIAAVTLAYSALGGLQGVLLTDLAQFCMAMVGSVAATFYILQLPQVGGLHQLLAHPTVQERTAFWPSFEAIGWAELAPVFLIPLLVQWWAAYYPGSEPGGGGYIVQRMLSARDEEHARAATLTFNVLHYAVRPWPWILVALASVVVFPGLQDIQRQFPDIPETLVRDDLAYPAMLTFLPPGLLGLVVTSLAAAYMSTISTSLNWGSSILVNDVYRRFMNPQASDRRVVWAGRLCTLVLLVLACILAFSLESALEVFNVMLQIGAGTGLLYLLRWFWWRINALTELVAMAASFTVALLVPLVGNNLESWQQLVAGVAVTTLCWLPCAYFGPQTDKAKLEAFYLKIRPGGPGWNPVRRSAMRELQLPAAPSLAKPVVAAFLGSAGIYSILFMTGSALYGRPAEAGAYGIAGLIAAYTILRLRAWRAQE